MTEEGGDGGRGEGWGAGWGRGEVRCGTWGERDGTV